MGCLMLKELVKYRVFPVATVMAGSILLASCSSSVSRFDMPMFGLSGSDDTGAPTASLSNGFRNQQEPDRPTAFRDGGALSDFGGEDATPDNTANIHSRNSYMPPQTAAPEVRAARYKVDPSVYRDSRVQRQASADTYADRTSPDRPVYGNNDGGMQNRMASRYDAAPMKPLREARRSLLPSEPSGYTYTTRSPNTSHRGQSGTNKKPSPSRKAARVLTTLANGDQKIAVQQGDTLYSISRHYNIPVIKLMELNGLSDSKLSIGQQLIVPGRGSSMQVARSVTTSATPAVSRPVQATSSGTYTVRPGETFHSIARKLNISADSLADINGITDPGSIRPGEVLILPTDRHSTVKKQVVRRSVAAGKNTDGKGLKVRSVKTKSIRLGAVQKKSAVAPQKHATVAVRSSRKKTAGKTAFRWPVQGRIIEKFGTRQNGTHNDGINLAVPAGTRVRAAEAGVVAYAGNELKDYGNLVLIRHANNWVSAYAHNGKLLVRRGDKIRRGQVVARAGATGSVEQPQVHFELRKGSKPVNPLKYMAGT